MKKITSRLLVIDASVIQGAGELPDTHAKVVKNPSKSKAKTAEKNIVSRPKACRDFLDTVLRICHRVYVSDAIRNEWNDHMRGFAFKWQHRMATKGKIIRGNIGTPVELSLNFSVFDDNHWQAIKKDEHLLKAVWTADKELVTLDEKLKNALASKPEGQKLLEQIKWHNPEKNGTKGIET